MDKNQNKRPKYNDFPHHSPMGARFPLLRKYWPPTPNDVVLLGSLISLGIAMVGAVFLVGQVLLAVPDPNRVSIMDRIYVILPLLVATFAVGCVLGIIGVRRLNNLALPVIMNIIAGIIMLIIIVFYMYVVMRLWTETYEVSTFVKFIAVIASAFSAFFGVHLVSKRRDLFPFAIPLLAVNLVHLFILVFRYVILYDLVDYSLFQYDITFFLFMIFMSYQIVGGKFFSNIQDVLDLLFEENPNKKEPS